MVQTLPQIGRISAGDIETVAIDFRLQLDDGELLTGTPTVAEVTTTDLTIDDETVNTGELVILTETVVAGQAVQFTVSGQVAGSTYRVRITVITDSDPFRRFVRDALIECYA